MAAAYKKQLEDNDKYRDNDSMLESILEFVDPTGISSWDDVSRSFRNPLGSNWDRAFNLFSATSMRQSNCTNLLKSCFIHSLI